MVMALIKSIFIHIHQKEDTMFINKLFSRLMRREEGQTLSEYALILVLIAVVAIIAVTLLGNQISAVINNIANAL